MREIHFRAWHKKIKDWVLATNFLIDGVGFYYWTGLGCKLKMLNEDDRDNIILIQFTGLKDKNGKEIYEGDIVKVFAYEELFEVIFNQTLSMFQFGSFQIRSISKLNNLGYDDLILNNCEVIGNIYENPEVLSNSSPPVRTSDKKSDFDKSKEFN